MEMNLKKEHRVYKIGKSAKVITIYDNLCRVLDIDIDDELHIDWIKAIKTKSIKIVRRE